MKFSLLCDYYTLCLTKFSLFLFNIKNNGVLVKHDIENFFEKNKLQIKFAFVFGEFV